MIQFPPCGLRYGDRRDIELMRKDGNGPFIAFWIVMALAAALIAAH